jgi:hypothetical protein
MDGFEKNAMSNYYSPFDVMHFHRAMNFKGKDVRLETRECSVTYGDCDRDDQWFMKVKSEHVDPLRPIVYI